MAKRKQTADPRRVGDVPVGGYFSQLRWYRRGGRDGDHFPNYRRCDLNPDGSFTERHGSDSFEVGDPDEAIVDYVPPPISRDEGVGEDPLG